MLLIPQKLELIDELQKMIKKAMSKDRTVKRILFWI